MRKYKLLTHSSMTCAKTCLKMYEYKYVLGISKEREDTPLRVGGLVHYGLEFNVVPEFQDYPGWCEDEEDRYKWDCDQALARGMVRAYLEYWSDDAVETIENEKEFLIPIINPDTKGVTPNFKAAGKIDKVVKLPDGRLAIMEHKTTSDDLDVDSAYWRRLMMDQQISHYFIGAQSTGLDVETVLYDVIRRPQLKAKNVPVLDKDGLKIVEDENGDRVYKKDNKPRQSAGDGMTLKTTPESPGAFEDRVYEDMMSRPEHYFCRREIPRIEADIEEFLQELWQQQKMLNECHKHEYWFRNTSACFKWNKPCEYFDVCTEGGIRDGIAPLGYEFKKPHMELNGEGGDK